MNVGIYRTLQMLAAVVRVERTCPELCELARKLTEPPDLELGRGGKMHRLVDELHRRFKYAPEHRETVGPVPIAPGGTVDADDACLFVAALASSVGIQCRFVGARYGRSWTCFVDYRVEDGSWETIDPLRQTDREPDERVFGPLLEVSS